MTHALQTIANRMIVASTLYAAVLIAVTFSLSGHSTPVTSHHTVPTHGHFTLQPLCDGFNTVIGC